jgi:hypothetical protein
LIKSVLFNRPLREKAVVGILMTLGIFCACGSIPKLVKLRNYATDIDATWQLGTVFMWAMVELFVGIIVASIPALKSTFESTLTRFGLLSIEKTQPLEQNMQFVLGDWDSEYTAGDTLRTNTLEEIQLEKGVSKMA